ncbi:DUF4116 domain-containing protein [Legionella lytica]|uniref:DUF4116 domain-containing protein n=1 Tax=Legionella lytica TaxID=96232 RepID=A0ABY4YCL6_9GAMM|nr:DUF4116 domain-containing protein [Legionella lytica]USQ14887.1 DUF4116 domain-containing protein [Legionella lytica]
MNNPVFYLSTEMLYQKPDFTKHDEAMKTYLQSQFGEEYLNEQTPITEKWDKLMEAFKTQVPAEYKQLFESFQQRRKQVANNNRFNLSLKDALALFENFYFLYNGDKPDFCISKSTQAKFLEELKRAMSPGVCEPGIATELNTHLRKYRSDTNWILVELHEQRCNIIQRIADEYNTINNVGESLSIHTVMHMFNLAKNKSLGVGNEKEIQDAYTYLSKTQSMTAYFESVYEEYFSQYEANVINNLAEYALLSMRMDPLAELDLTEWDNNNALVLTESETLSLYPKLGEFFGLYFAEDDRQSIVEYDETLSIFKKSDVLAQLKSLVEEKLKRENFLVNFNDLNKENAEGYGLRLPTGISVEVLCTLNEMLQNAQNNPQKIREILTDNKKLIEKYPCLIAIAVLANPKLWRYLPRTLRNNSDFLDSLIGKINFAIEEMIQKGTIEQVDSLIELLLMMSKPTGDLLSGYSSSSFLNNREIALRLVTKNGLFYKYLSPDLQESQEIMDYALLQNPGVSKYFPDNRQLQLNSDTNKLINFEVPFYQNWENNSLLERMDKSESVLSLLDTEFLSLSTLTQLAQPLSPRELLWIMEARRQKGFANLPELTEEGLNQFIEALELTENGWEPNYLGFKRRTPQHSQHLNQDFSFNQTYKKALAKRCVADSNQWLSAFFAFQKQIPVYYKPFSGLEEVWEQLKLTRRIAFSFLKSIGETLIVLGTLGLNYAVTLLPPLIDFYFAPYIALIINCAAAYTGGLFLLSMLQLYVGSVMINNWLDNSINAFVNIVLFITALAIPTLFTTWMLTLEMVYIGCYLLALAIAASSSIFGTQWSFAEINTLTSTALNHWLFASLYLIISSIQTVGYFLNLMVEWPRHFFAMTIPWVTRTLASCFNTESPAIGEDLLKIKVENSISRLLESDSVSANLKASVLESLWKKIQQDVEKSQGTLTFEMALNRQYTLTTNLNTCQKSFMDVAEMHRSDKEEFNPHTTQTRYSFFGIKLKTSTASNLKEYAVENVEIDEPPALVFA